LRYDRKRGWNCALVAFPPHPLGQMFKGNTCFFYAVWQACEARLRDRLVRLPNSDTTTLDCDKLPPLAPIDLVQMLAVEEGLDRRKVSSKAV